ncbi:unnamed protein product [Schistosoma margrebowiei]|uniref:Uncharacterized protein n=1 Tax=Schistosoma margrebowiei TaxID=48269 RepID=A0A183LJ95_9TREM|nr:unnamed protein product [Schistosoma margrebowiei]
MMEWSNQSKRYVNQSYISHSHQTINRSSTNVSKNNEEILTKSVVHLKDDNNDDNNIGDDDNNNNNNSSTVNQEKYYIKKNQLDDLDFADDLALLSHTHEQMQIKTANVAAVSASVGLNIHKGKTKVLKYNTENNNPITLDGETLEDVGSFTPGNHHR